MLIDLAKMAKIHKFGLANSLLDSPMATWLTLTGTLPMGNQFGFKPKLGTDMCIYSLKESIGSYSQLN